MSRTDPIDQLKTKYQFFQMKEKLQTQLTRHEQAISEIKRDLNALSIIEQSKYLIEEESGINSQRSVSNKNTIKDRMLVAMETLSEKFTRMELFEAVKKDGKGKVNEGSLSVFFPILQREGYITKLENPRGREPGIFTKGNKSA